MPENILIIDNDRKIREKVCELLESEGYKVFAASNGMEGLMNARKSNPDLILCDVALTGLDGYGVLRALGNIPETAGIPFVFLTAESDPVGFRKGMDLGADDYLAKPFSRDDLLMVIGTRLHKRRLLKESDGYGKLADLINASKIPPDARAISNLCKIKKIKEKNVLFMESDPVNYIYFIVSGKIKTFRATDFGKEFLTEIYKTGDFFGYTSLMNGGEYRESASAMEDSELALIPKEDFFRMLHSSSEVALKFIRLISNNLEDAEEKMVRLAYNSARKRVAEALVFLCRKYNPEGKENSPFPANRENISGIAGVAPESVSRNLGNFRDEGLIEVDFGTVRITDFKKMEALKN